MRNLLLIILVFVSTDFVLAQEQTSPFHWKRLIETMPEQEELLSVGLDSEIYRETLPSLHDLRIQTSSGQTVPFLVQQRIASITNDARKAWRVKEPQLTPVDDTGLTIEFELEEDDPAPDGITILTPLKDFEKSIQVLAISPDGTESQVGQRTLIYDYTQFMDVQQVSVPLEETTARKFRIQISGLTSDQESQLKVLSKDLRGNEEVLQQTISAIHQRPFRIDHIELWAEYEEATRQVIDDQPYPAQSVSVMVNDQDQTTTIGFETNGEPLNSFRFETTSKNFQRTVSIYVVDPNKPKSDALTLLAQSMIHRFAFRELQEEKLTVDFPTSREQAYFITIGNEDNPPLEEVEVTPLGTIDELVFIASPNESYELLYGASDAEKPALDTAAIRASLKDFPIPVASPLGAAVPLNPTQPPAQFQWKDLINNPYLLGVGVLVMIVALGYFLYVAAQKIDDAEASTSE